MAQRNLLLMFCFVITMGCAHAPRGHRFDRAEAWAQRFDAASRDAWQKPEEVIEALNLPRNAKVADLGSGTGYFAVRLARAVPDGVVYGLDSEPDMTRYLAERARREGLSQLQALTVSPEAPSLPEKVDLVLCVNTWHHVPNRQTYLDRLRLFLAPNARVVVIDFTLDAPEGPPRDMRLSAHQVQKEFEAKGFFLKSQMDFLPRQYGLSFVAAEWGQGSTGSP